MNFFIFIFFKNFCCLHFIYLLYVFSNFINKQCILFRIHYTTNFNTDQFSNLKNIRILEYHKCNNVLLLFSFK